MSSRIISATAAELSSLSSASAVRAAIEASEGRVLACETITRTPALLPPLSNLELAASQGADMLICNMYDVNDPYIAQVSEIAHTDEPLLSYASRLSGRVIGINLEPVPQEILASPTKTSGSTEWAITAGRLATVANALAAKEQGAQFLVLTGNPSSGVTNEEMVACVRRIRQAVSDSLFLIAGRMHAAGVTHQAGTAITSPEIIRALVDAGADCILFPAPGTIPGITLEIVHNWVAFAHQHGALAMTAIGTSQEGADIATIRKLALLAKQSGADIHHLGDCGYVGVSVPENIAAYSITIRGRRHHYFRTASSLLR